MDGGRGPVATIPGRVLDWPPPDGPALLGSWPP